MIIGDRYFIDDIESGKLIEVSKEHYELYNTTMSKFMEELRPKLNSKYKGVLLITGTSGDLESGNLQTIFERPDEKGII